MHNDRAEMCTDCSYMTVRLFHCVCILYISVKQYTTGWEYIIFVCLCSFVFILLRLVSLLLLGLPFVLNVTLASTVCCATYMNNTSYFLLEGKCAVTFPSNKIW